ncbi:para-aminobenzoate synthetase component 2 [Thalassobacillus cyri]|uniref:Para-aminobenzoate synthetase component 2 n=1 Tax=Thalassobacillus cyri TaxID=571932 RepID=A0A1H3XYH7_9BACI|nr:aminodeoxychorismate/anthranilate synthase component II [Thalassobacillus cyri]SEA04509.1 para-aminobenzoate synthetase component 2 [Thalassobacillus cyri]
MIVVIDNYDSFTYNLVQYFRQLDHQVRVCQNHEISPQEIDQLQPDLIVLSPGPGNPDEAQTSREVLDEFHTRIPVLGVCLGHQAIVKFFGGEVIKGEKPMHGKVSCITHDQLGAFEGIPSPTLVTRYHSLIAERSSMPESLDITAKTEDGVIMGVRHKEYPVEGLQFHPESILSDAGFHMLENVYRNAQRWGMRSLREEV